MRYSCMLHPSEMGLDEDEFDAGGFSTVPYQQTIDELGGVCVTSVWRNTDGSTGGHRRFDDTVNAGVAVCRQSLAVV